MSGITKRPPPRPLRPKERRAFAKRFGKEPAFKDAARRALSMSARPGWRQELAKMVESGDMTMWDWLVWSLIFTGAGDADILGERMVDRPPDPRAIKLLAELVHELKPVAEEGAVRFQFVLPSRPLPIPEFVLDTPAIEDKS